ncbi:dynein light chain 1, axonemal-like [Hyposmocoma kahamanoa]|uniref:dynein light chain 1, axonemal-like n=1 Tax=Hyposmocoma kahamanoa TaxID=1477025 RepID=UPI000E6D82F9|nr:dynein light chain 1, axonemal-like [Hyposmocoma kahamanoa]XP_026323688.1 dynein light chain 1, axonemal-like [Hyposmocoma kahamanoa]
MLLNQALKPLTCKEAITRWEKEKGEVASEATVIEMQFQWPPIEKMDGALSTLVNCEKLSLSSNIIDKIAGIAGMRNLKILSLGRNNIKTLSGIETVAETLEELWISYNGIDKLKVMTAMKNLKVFYIANNNIREWAEVNRLQDCPNLRDLVLFGNPVMDTQADAETWRNQVQNRLKQVSKIDGVPIVRVEDFEG